MKYFDKKYTTSVYTSQKNSVISFHYITIQSRIKSDNIFTIQLAPLNVILVNVIETGATIVTSCYIVEL